MRLTRIKRLTVIVGLTIIGAVSGVSIAHFTSPRLTLANRDSPLASVQVRLLTALLLGAAAGLSTMAVVPWTIGKVRRRWQMSSPAPQQYLHEQGSMRSAPITLAILAAGFLIAGSICVAASYVSAAAMFGASLQKIGMLDYYLRMSRGLRAFGWVFIAFGVALAFWAIAGATVQRLLARLKNDQL